MQSLWSSEAVHDPIRSHVHQVVLAVFSGLALPAFVGQGRGQWSQDVYLGARAKLRLRVLFGVAVAMIALFSMFGNVWVNIGPSNLGSHHMGVLAGIVKECRGVLVGEGRALILTHGDAPCI